MYWLIKVHFLSRVSLLSLIKGMFEIYASVIVWYGIGHTWPYFLLVILYYGKYSDIDGQRIGCLLALEFFASEPPTDYLKRSPSRVLMPLNWIYSLR